MAKQNYEIKNNPVVLLTVFLAAKRRGDFERAKWASEKLARQGIIISSSRGGLSSGK